MIHPPGREPTQSRASHRAGLLERLLMRYARRRLSQEMREYREPPPEPKARWFRRSGSAQPSQQVFRSLIHVSYYARPRG